jgi:hypothetical protein
MSACLGFWYFVLEQQFVLIQRYDGFLSQRITKTFDWKVVTIILPTCPILTDETSKGRMKIIIKEKYQATNVAKVTKTCCFLQLPY